MILFEQKYIELSKRISNNRKRQLLIYCALKYYNEFKNEDNSLNDVAFFIGNHSFELTQKTYEFLPVDNPIRQIFHIFSLAIDKKDFTDIAYNSVMDIFNFMEKNDPQREISSYFKEGFLPEE